MARRKENVIVLKPGEEDANASFRARVIRKILKLLKSRPEVYSEKEIIAWLVENDDVIKQYVMEHRSVAVVRFLIWKMARDGKILKAKVLGDDKHVFYFHPVWLEYFKKEKKIIEQ